VLNGEEIMQNIRCMCCQPFLVVLFWKTILSITIKVEVRDTIKIIKEVVINS